MSRRAVAAVALGVVVYVAGALTNLVFTAHAVNVSQMRWCATLALLTSQAPAKVPPPGPHATAAQKDAYRTWTFYGDLVGLRKDYGCG